MKVLDLSFPSPQANLACDEALLDRCEEGGSGEILRFWESQTHFVVLGYSNKMRQEVNLFYCHRHKIPVLRRISGGGTVLQGPGCLSYSLILNIKKRNLESITQTNRFVMEKLKHAFGAVLKKPVAVKGHTDLVLGNKKFSGNAQRRKRKFILFHGTFLLDFDLKKIEYTLKLPEIRPEYRKDRPHEEFVTNLCVKTARVKEAIKKEWSTSTKAQSPLKEKIAVLVKSHYIKKGWNEKF